MPRRGEQAIDQFFISHRVGIGDERGRFFRRRRQADEIERQAADERAAIGQSRQRQLVFASFAAMKRSMGESSSTGTGGTSGRTTAFSDQCISFLVAVDSGQLAPASIQRRKSAICSAESAAPSGGIRKESSVLATLSISGLLSALPGTNAAPESPPAKAAAPSSSRRPLVCFAGPWHLLQWAAKIGCMSRAKSRAG
jgi:hypothetical protein